MGGLVRSVFGGSSSKSSQKSENLYRDQLRSAFMPTAQATGASSNALMSLLGLGGNGAQAAAQANFRNTPGYSFARDEGIRGVMDKFAAKGLANSGAAMKGIAKYTTGLADQTYNNYMSQLLGLGQLGTQAGSIVSDAGKVSTGTSSGSQDSGGLGKAIGFGLSLISDERTKRDIVKVGEHEGLGVYEFAYKDDPDTRYTGVMAQEVLKKFPEAVGNYLGYYVVDYSKIPNWKF